MNDTMRVCVAHNRVNVCRKGSPELPCRWSEEAADCQRVAMIARRGTHLVDDESWLEDDGGPMVIAVEAIPDGIDATPQALWVRVGPVYDIEGERPEPGVWIEYQESYLGSGMSGPVLLTPATWRELAAAVETRLKRRGL